MKVDVLVAEIGSTTTIVNAFNLFQEPLGFLGKGFSRTTVETDVTIGLKKAIEHLKTNLKIDELDYDEMFATSSAAGGLKMTVHGLVYEMTAKAAKQAALNAGANIHLVTANLIEDHDIEKIKDIKPNIIVVAGGTDFGEKEVAYQNVLKLKDLSIPMIYSGNIQNHDRIKALNINHLRIVENVYPRVDDFNILPLRKAIYETFEENIVHAKGMHKINEMIKGHIIPTPGSVMETTLILNDLIKGVMTIDVGGATTDVHSVCEPNQIYQKYHDGEPLFKRTVEGDLGVYINRNLVYEQTKQSKLKSAFDKDTSYIMNIIENEPYIPETEDGKKLIDLFTETCVEKALDRHVGDLKRVFTTNGMKVIPDGKDTSQVQAIFLTGGACLYHEQIEPFIRNYLEHAVTKLVPSHHLKIFKDEKYLFSSLGVLSLTYKDEVKKMLAKMFHLKEV